MEMGLRLKSVKVTFGPFLETEFEPTEREAEAAWVLFVELSTRISTQPFDDRNGHLRDVLTSLYSVLNETRTVLKGVGPSASNGQMYFPSIALLLITDHIAPFLTHWHEQLSDYEALRPENRPVLEHEKAWEYRSACLDELRKLQEVSIAYTALFSEIAGVRKPSLT
jgi:hypothetical protein